MTQFEELVLENQQLRQRVEELEPLAEAWRAVLREHEQSMRCTLPATSWFVLHKGIVDQIARLAAIEEGK